MRNFSLALPFGSLVGTAVQAADAKDWLLRSAQAERQQDFLGTFVYQRGSSFATHRVEHRIDHGRVLERLVRLDGPPQQTTRIDGHGRCAAAPQAAMPAPVGQDPARILQSYDVHLVGDSRVAGRASVVAVVPKDRHRYGFEFNLDRATALPLSWLTFNEQGQLLERLQFTDLKLGLPAPATAATAEQAVACRQAAVSQALTLSDVPWQVGWLPPGFSLIRATRRPTGGVDEPVDQLTFGDGLGSLSVFLAASKDPGDLQDARSELGPTVAVSKHRRLGEGAVMVTVVGEVPMGTAERVALSMRATEAQTLQ